MLESGLPSVNSNSGVGLGFLYRINKKTNKALRFHTLYKRDENSWRGSSFQLIGDTLYDKTIRQKQQAYLIGSGLEVHRNFYKQLFLYATVDARMGYSVGNFKEQVLKRVNTGSSPSLIESLEIRNLPNYRSRGFVLDFMGSIGAKLDFKHIKIGLETGPIIHTSYTSFETNVNYSIFDLDMEFFAHRVYLTYKF